MSTAAVDYGAFLARKTQLDGRDGFEPAWLPDRFLREVAA